MKYVVVDDEDAIDQKLALMEEALTMLGSTARVVAPREGDKIKY